MFISQLVADLQLKFTGDKNLQTVLEGGITDQIRVAELITQDVSHLNFAMSWFHVRNLMALCYSHM